jgi:uncharacterized membrane protein
MTNPARLFSLDALRGTAILAMVVVHFVVYWSAPAGTSAWLQVALNHLSGADFGAAGFLMLAGMGLVLSRAREPARVAMRSACLFAVGLLMLLLAWGPGRLWQWDILTLIAVATALSLGLRPLPSWLLVAIAAAVAGLSPRLRRGLDLARLWGGPLQPVPGLNGLVPGLLWDPPRGYLSGWRFGDIARGFLLAAEFPLFPWIAHPILGIVVGRALVAGRLGPAAPRLALGGLGLAGGGMALAIAAARRGGCSPITDYLAPLSFYPSSFSMVLLQVGVALIVISLLYCYLDHKAEHGPRAGVIGRCLVRAGQASLSVYFAHFMLVAWPLRLASRLVGRDLEAEREPPRTA